jgi:RNA polymerase sigma-70 factor (ECF subfamily)
MRRSPYASPSAAADPIAPFGTDAAFHSAWLAHRRVLHSIAVRRLGDAGLAEDAVQETFLRAWVHAERFDASRGSVRTWLAAILRNLLVDMARARNARPRTDPLVGDVVDRDETDAIVASLAMGDALQQLNAVHRHVVVLSYVMQRPHAEIAQELGVPIGTVRSRLFYARAALGSALRDLDTAA